MACPFDHARYVTKVARASIRLTSPPRIETEGRARDLVARPRHADSDDKAGVAQIATYLLHPSLECTQLGVQMFEIEPS